MQRQTEREISIVFDLFIILEITFNKHREKDRRRRKEGVDIHITSHPFLSPTSSHLFKRFRRHNVYLSIQQNMYILGQEGRGRNREEGLLFTFLLLL